MTNKKEKNYIYFNFDSYKRYPDMIKYYNIINNKGRGKSYYLAKAFINYKKYKNISPMFFEMISMINSLSYVCQKYNITEDNLETKVDVLLSSIDFKQNNTKTINTGKMTLGYYKDDDLGNEIVEFFNTKDNKVNVVNLVDIIKTYVRSGEDIDYLEDNCKEYLEELKTLGEAAKNNPKMKNVLKLVVDKKELENTPEFAAVTKSYKKAKNDLYDALAEAFE